MRIIERLGERAVNDFAERRNGGADVGKEDQAVQNELPIAGASGEFFKRIHKKDGNCRGGKAQGIDEEFQVAERIKPDS